MDESVDSLCNATVFSTIDANGRFWKVEVTRGTVQKQLSFYITDFSDLFVYYLNSETHLALINEQ